MQFKREYLAVVGVLAIAGVFVGSMLSGEAEGGPRIFGINSEFYFFTITLIGVAIFHHHALYVALTGLGSILAFKLLFISDFELITHLEHEASILLNLLGLLLGFAILAKHFENSSIPIALPRFLPDGWLGGFVLLALTFVISSFLDNIAAAMIGGTVAMTVYKGRVNVGYVAALVAASNGGGSGSVVGDTTTTMIWIEGAHPLEVLHGFIAAVPALFVFGIVTSIAQNRYQPIVREDIGVVRVSWSPLAVVALILVGAIVANFWIGFPAAGVWAAILLGALFTRTPWVEVPAALKGSIFLLSLVLCASMMPVKELPTASWQTAFGLGFVSAVFDNIPLTKLALEQGGYDWGILAYTVGFGGSMIWFGSSAGVAISNLFPEARSVGAWLRHGWSVAVAYVVGFAIVMTTWGWNPHEIGERRNLQDSHETAAVELESSDTDSSGQEH